MNSVSAPYLDRSHLATGITSRRRRLADLEAAMAASCEAAARGTPRGIRVEDRETRDRAMWRRYLDAAARLEPPARQFESGTPTRDPFMLRQYHAPRFRGGDNPRRVGVIAAGSIYYLQNEAFFRDRYGGRAICRTPWLV